MREREREGEREALFVSYIGISMTREFYGLLSRKSTTTK